MLFYEIWLFHIDSNDKTLWKNTVKQGNVNFVRNKTKSYKFTRDWFRSILMTSFTCGFQSRFFFLLQLQGVYKFRYILKNFAIRDNVPETHKNSSFCAKIIRCRRPKRIWFIYGVAKKKKPKNGTVDFSGLCSHQQLSFFTLLDRASFYNNIKIIKFGWELFISWVISNGLSFSGFARFPEFQGTINDSFGRP